jgi:branched-chain amino acid aminotransferase
MYVYINGRLVPEEDAVVSVYDHGFLYGDGVYETMRSYAGEVFMMEEHLARLERSAALTGLVLPMGRGETGAAVHETLEANSLSDAYIRISVTRGPGPPGLDPALCKRPTFVIYTGEITGYPAGFYERGVSMIIPRTRRNLKEALDPMIKSHNFLNNILAKREAIEAGAYEALMLNHRGFLTEGTVCNVFFAKGGVLHTPSVGCGILDGITRAHVIGLAAKAGIKVVEGEFTKEDIYGADEVFITNTTMEVMPVSRIDGKTFGVGGTTRLLMKAYRESTSE